MKIKNVNTKSAGQISRFAWLALLFCVCLLCPPNLWSQPTNIAVRPSNRWLLIAETSRATQPRAEAVAQTAGNLLLSGMNGQMRAGDTLGVWTFNDALHSGGFPLQTWSPDKSKDIAERLALFLARQKFENRPNFDKVLPTMGTLVTNSQFITIVLITGGSETMRGTPYDRAINSIYKQWQGQQNNALMPFVTVLRAQGGLLADFKVNTPPSAVELPALPPELLIPDPPPPKPPEIKPAEPPPPVAVVPSLIVHGRKPVPESESISNPVPAIAVIPAPAPMPPTNQNVSSETNFPASPKPPVSIMTNTLVAVTNAGVTNVPMPVATNQAAAIPATATENSSGGKTLWLVGVVAALAGGGLVFLLVRRSRRGPHTSLITRSLDRDQK